MLAGGCDILSTLYIQFGCALAFCDVCFSAVGVLHMPRDEFLTQFRYYKQKIDQDLRCCEGSCESVSRHTS